MEVINVMNSVIWTSLSLLLWHWWQCYGAMVSKRPVDLLLPTAHVDDHSTGLYWLHKIPTTRQTIMHRTHTLDAVHCCVLDL